MQSVIGAVLAIGTLFLPESPRWLIDTEQDEEGMGVLADLHGDGDPEDERVRLLSSPAPLAAGISEWSESYCVSTLL